MISKQQKEDKDIKISINSDNDKDPSRNAERSEETLELPLEELSKQELVELLEKARKEAEKNYDFFLRSQAEMENLKKRHQKEKNEWRLFANEKLIKELLPAIDNLRKAIEHTHGDNSLDALREGLELTLKGLMGALINAGLEEVETGGEIFDPCFHEAISMQENTGYKDGEIIQELQKGYVLNQRLIRPALVIVNKGTTGGTQELPNDAVCETDKE